MVKYDLEERLINFAVLIIKISEFNAKSSAGLNLTNQMTRSGTSTALNYGEAQAAESRKDFLHKMRIVLKELRETLISLKILQKSGLNTNVNLLTEAINENIELISIFVKSIETAKRNNLYAN